MSKPVNSSALFAALLGLSSFSLVFAQPAIDVQVDNGLVSIRASNAAASDVALVLAEKLGITVVVTGGSRQPMNVDITDESLEDALGMLSPNNMLVKSGKGADSRIVEVVLMFDDEGSSSGSDSASDSMFLPSGSPADEVIDTNPDVYNNQETASPEYSDAASQNDLGGNVNGDLPSGIPGPQAFDPVTGAPIDPQTGLPVE